MQVRSGRVQSELDPELVPPIQPALQMLLDVDLNRALAQALEERSAHTLPLGDRVGTEVDLWVRRQRGREQLDDRFLDLLHNRDDDVRALVCVADPLLQRVDL